MKRALKKMARGTALAAILSLGLFLVASAILRGAGWSLPEMLKETFASMSEVLAPSNSDEVKNYVLFTKVKFNDREVVTGIRYASNSKRKIEEQWCYLSGGNRPDGARTDLYLAEVSENGVKTVTDFSASALSQFNLTDQAARGLVTTHCRLR